jgi:hypothetical protein
MYIVLYKAKGGGIMEPKLHFYQVQSSYRQNPNRNHKKSHEKSHARFSPKKTIKSHFANFLSSLFPLLKLQTEKKSFRLFESKSRKGGQHKAGLVDAAVVVAVALILLLLGQSAERLGDVAAGLLAAHHEADLARGVGRDRGVGVLDDGEDLAAGLLKLGDELEVEPLVLSYR